MISDLLEQSGLGDLPALALALGIGLLIGLERERNPAAQAGLRTFGLTGLLGAVAALLADDFESAWILAVALAAVGVTMVAATLRRQEPDADPGTTTTVAAMLTFAYGAMAMLGYSTYAVMLAITTAVLLYLKVELRGISQALTRRDLYSILQFGVLSLLVLPVLPDEDYGPYAALNPHQIWLMVVLISGVGLAGYVALRFMGGTRAVRLLGLLGGLVSSTATTLVYARHVRDQPETAAMGTVVVLLANQVVLPRLALIAAVASPDAAPALAAALAGGLALGGAFTLLAWRRFDRGGTTPTPQIANPTELKTALGFGALYASVLVISAWTNDRLGEHGMYAVAAVSGLTDTDAITLSSLRLFELGHLAKDYAVTAVLIALSANILFKLALVLGIGGRALARACTPAMLATAAGAWLGMWLLRF